MIDPKKPKTDDMQERANAAAKKAIDDVAREMVANSKQTDDELVNEIVCEAKDVVPGMREPGSDEALEHMNDLYERAAYVFGVPPSVCDQCGAPLAPGEWCRHLH